MFAMLEPMALPTARLPACSMAAVADTISSGAEVPNATTVRPTIIGVIPRLRAVDTAPDTKRSALQTSTIRPITMAHKNNIMVGNYFRGK
jgi:hypothetical protein